MTRNRRMLFTLVLLLAAIRACPAETLVQTDFSQNASHWVLQGDARLLTLEGRQILSLVQNEGGQTGVVWTDLLRKLPSFSFIADLRLRFYPAGPGDCPADGVTMVFAAPPGTEALTINRGGGNLGLFGGAVPTFTCFEINTWYGQGLGTDQERNGCTANKYVTFAFDVINPAAITLVRQPGISDPPEKGGTKIGQVLPPAGMSILNGGWYRYQWNLDGATNRMSVYVTGLEKSNRRFQKRLVLQVGFPRSPIAFEGRFGLTAATGGATEAVEVAAVRIESPMLPPQ